MPVGVRFTDVVLVVMSSVILPILALGATRLGHHWASFKISLAVIFVMPFVSCRPIVQ